LDFFCLYVLYSTCRPSDSTVSEEAVIEPGTVATSALLVRRSNHSARSHPQQKPCIDKFRTTTDSLYSAPCTPHTVIRFVLVSAKFGTCTVVSILFYSILTRSKRITVHTASMTDLSKLRDAVRRLLSPEPQRPRSLILENLPQLLGRASPGTATALAHAPSPPSPAFNLIPELEEIRVSPCIARKGYLNVLEEKSKTWKRRCVMVKNSARIFKENPRVLHKEKKFAKKYCMTSTSRSRTNLPDLFNPKSIQTMHV
jgi:hypothetical protein